MVYHGTTLRMVPAKRSMLPTMALLASEASTLTHFAGLEPALRGQSIRRSARAMARGTQIFTRATRRGLDAKEGQTTAPGIDPPSTWPPTHSLSKERDPNHRLDSSQKSESLAKGKQRGLTP